MNVGMGMVGLFLAMGLKPIANGFAFMEALYE
jgi:hypothetical protein